MMVKEFIKHELINPGDINSIYAFSPRKTDFYDTRFYDDKYEPLGFKIETEVECFNDFVLINVGATYKCKGDKDYILLVMQYSRGFMIVKESEFTRDDLDNIIIFCVGKINEQIKENKIGDKYKYLPNQLEVPYMSEDELIQAVQSVNLCE